MRPLHLLLCLLFLSITTGYAQRDSLTLVQAPWTHDTLNGIVLKTLHFQHKEYFQSNQFIAILEIPGDSPHRLGFACDSVRTRTSTLAERHDAIAAVNGSFFDMRQSVLV